MREDAHNQGLETCAVCAPQRTPKCIPLCHQSDHQELESTVSHLFDKHLRTYSFICNAFQASLSDSLNQQPNGLGSIVVSVQAVRMSNIQIASVQGDKLKEKTVSPIVHRQHVPIRSWPLTKHLNSRSGLRS